jgi:hypothetical protein
MAPFCLFQYIHRADSKKNEHCDISHEHNKSGNREE